VVRLGMLVVDVDGLGVVVGVWLLVGGTGTVTGDGTATVQVPACSAMVSGQVTVTVAVTLQAGRHAVRTTAATTDS